MADLTQTESEIFLTRILARDLELLEEPHLEWEELIAGYAVRGLLVRDTGRIWRDQAGPTERLMPAG